MSKLDDLAKGGFAQSRWLTNAARDLSQRDILNALNDAEALAAALRADFETLTGSK